MTNTGPVRSVFRRARPTILAPIVWAIAAVALLGAGGCASAPAETGGSGGDTSAASSSGDTSAASGGGGTTSVADDQGVKFAECVRENGVSDFPDPDASGDYNYGVSVTPEVWTKAVDACKDLQPPGTLSSDRNPEQQKEGLEFAQCVRENGVADFPDPINGEPLINTYRIPSSEKSGGMTILNAAIDKCRDLLGKAAGK